MARIYADASALVKLGVDEPESEALRAYLGRGNDVVTSIVARVEVGRALRRLEVGNDPLSGVQVVALDADILARAIEVEPRFIRTLDAIHLATAVLLRDDIDAFVAYDERLLAAAQAAGLKTASPT